MAVEAGTEAAPAEQAQGRPKVSISSEDAAAMQAVKVALRIRPLNAKERAERCRECVRTVQDQKQVIIGKDKAFTYDFVFGADCLQEPITQDCVLPMVAGLFRGLNATVLAYGQTGSGKTHTMGSGNSIGLVSEALGIIPRCIHEIFTQLEQKKQEGAEFLVTASFIELYNEDFNDLLDPGFQDKSKTIQLRDDPNSGGVMVVGIKEEEVKGVAEILALLEKGSLCRTTGSTNMNATSSRSHAVFTISIEQSLADGEFASAKMRFVDLAGSERAKKTGAEGQRFKEGIAINQGLLCLGNVISVLGDPSKKGEHVRYRDSKLTRLLQDSLGGNSITLMIACISPADSNFDESLNTLKYANRARNIQNKPVVNKDPHSLQLAALKAQITSLQLELLKGRSIGGDTAAAGTSTVANADFELLSVRNTQLEAQCKELITQVAGLTASERKAQEDLFSLQAKVGVLQLKADGVAIGSSVVGAEEVEGVLESHLRTIASLRAENQALEDAVHMLRNTGGGQGADSPMGSPALEAEPGGLEPLEEEALAEDEAEEQREFAEDQLRLARNLSELDAGIQEKAVLVQQLQRSQKAFNAMKHRYDMRMTELETVQRTLESDKSELLNELKKVEEDPTKGKGSRGELQGKLHSLNSQLNDGKKKQKEQSRLLRVREQADAQLRAMNQEVDRLKGQKEMLARRIKEEAERFKSRREQWVQEKKGLVKQQSEAKKAAMELKSEARRKDAMIKRKTQQVVESKLELQKGQQELLDKELALSKQRRWVEKELSKSAEVKEVNIRLQQDLDRRESKVKEMEHMMEERLLLQNTLAADSNQAGEKECALSSLDDAIESLDMQIEMDSERIEAAQEEMVSVSGVGAEAGGGYTLEDTVEAIEELEEAHATIQALFEKVEALEGAGRALDQEVGEYKEEAADLAAQLAATQQRLVLAEREWDVKLTKMQQDNEERILVMLNEVSETVQCSAPAAAEQDPASSTVAPGTPASSTTRILECQKEQIALLTEHHDYYMQQTHELKASLEAVQDQKAAAQLALQEVQGEVQELHSELAQQHEEPTPSTGIEASNLNDEDVSPEVLRTATEVEQDNKLGEWAQHNLATLGELWTQIGLPHEQQQGLRASIVSPVVRLVMGEFDRNMAHKQSLQDEMQELISCVVEHDQSLTESVKASLAGKTLYEVVMALREQAATLLTQAAAPVQLLLHKLQPPAGRQPKAACRWVARPIDAKLLKNKLAASVENFGAVKQRLPELEALAVEVQHTIEALQLSLHELWKVLGTAPEEEHRMRLEERVAAGGLKAVLELERAIDEARAGVRLKVREARSEVLELWLQAKTPGAEQDQFLAQVDTLGAVEAIQTLRSEGSRVQRLMDSMREILKTISVRESLSARIQEFEQMASNPDRLKGSSVKLLKEEKERKLFKRKNERLCIELAQRIKEWEEERGELFQVRGVPYLQVLTAETEQLTARGGTSLIKSASNDRLSPVNGSSAEAAPGTKAPSRPSSGIARPARRRSSFEPGTKQSKRLEEWRAERDAKK